MPNTTAVEDLTISKGKALEKGILAMDVRNSSVQACNIHIRKVLRECIKISIKYNIKESV